MTDQRELVERLDERARHVTSDIDAQTFKEAAALIRSMEERIGRLEGAVMKVAKAVRDYLPPDGIEPHELISLVIEATDNPEINPIIRSIEDVRS